MADRSLTLGTLFTSDIRGFMAGVTAMETRLRKMQAAFAKTGKGIQKSFTGPTKSVNALGSAMKKTTSQVTAYNKQISKTAGAMNRIVAAAKVTASYGIAATAIFAVTSALKAGLVEIINYDQALKNLQAITKATNAEVVGMGSAIKKTASETKFSVTEVADAMVLLGQAGFSATESMQSIDAVSRLATGTLSDMKVTSDLLTTTIRAFGLSTVESARVADVMSNAINRSKLTLDKLKIAFNFVGAAAAQTGLSLEETAASMMLLANHGLRASTIGTGLRQVLSRLLAPNRRLREEFEAQGIELSKVNPAMVGFEQSMRNILPVVYDTERGMVDMAKAYQLFGLRGAQALAVLAKGFAEGTWDDMLDFTLEVGSSARMAAKQMEGLGVKLKNLADLAKIVAVEFGEAGLTGVLKGFVDAMRNLAKIIAAFIASDIGGMLAGMAAWSLAMYGTIKALQLLGVAVVILSKKMQVLALSFFSTMGTAFRLNRALGAGGLVAGIKALNAALGASIGVIGGWAIVIAAVMVLIRHLITATQRRIEQLQKEQSETQSNVQVLESYGKTFDRLIKRKQRDIDVSKDHSVLVRRLSQDYTGLKDSLDKSSDSLEENKRLIEEAYTAELQKNIQQSAELIREYADAVTEANFWSGLWNATLDLVIGYLKWYYGLLRDLANFFSNEFAESLREAAQLLDALGLSFLADWARTAADAVKDLGTKIVDFFVGYGEGSEGAVEATKQQREQFVKMAQDIDNLSGGKKTLEGIVKEIEKLSGIEVDPKSLRQIELALKKATTETEEWRETMEDSLEDLPHMFREMYENMEGHQKIAFTKSIESMDKEIAAFKKKANEMGLEEEDLWDGITAIRAKHLIKFTEQMAKETKVSEEAVNKQIEAFDQLAERTLEAYHQQTAIIINEYLIRQAAAAGNNKELLKIEKTFQAELAKERHKLNKSIESIDKAREKQTRKLYKQTMDKMIEMHEDMVKDLKKKLQKLYDEIKDDRDDLVKELAEIDKQYAEDIRELNEKLLSDEQKWYADRVRINDLMHQARLKGDRAYLETARDLAKGLAQTLTDENGNVVKTLEETIRISKALLEEISLDERKLVKDSIFQKEKEMEGIKTVMGELDQSLVDFGKNIDDITRKELILRTEKTVANIKEVFNITSDFKTKWDALQDKTITLTVRYKYIGKPPSGGKESGSSTGEGGGTEGSSGTEGSGATEERYGGYITRKIGGAIARAFSFGSKLPGYGGGDKVKALLEPGEWVIRKEAVQKYGSGFFNKLNKMVAGADDVGATVAKKVGGMIGPSIPQPVQAFQGGGNVGAEVLTSQPTFNITIAPKFLTGDRAAMRQIAGEVQSAIKELNIRWGRK